MNFLSGKDNISRVRGKAGEWLKMSAKNRAVNWVWAITPPDFEKEP